MALRTPPLRPVHDDRGAKFTEFGGWDMPVEFESIQDEHHAVRNSVGRFDVSHMGEIEVAGPDAMELLQRLTTNDVGALDPGEAQYAAITTAEGIMIDDTVVYRLPDGATETGGTGGTTLDRRDYLFIPNAGNDAEIHERWVDHRDEWGLDATVRNATEEWAMFAIQGPDAVDHVRQAVEDGETGQSTVELDPFEAQFVPVDGVRSWVARTGYTGEDGFEVLCPWNDAQTVWTAFDGVQPCGLGARDTLRIEMGFLLSGQDFHPEDNPRTPYEAGIGFVVDLDAEPPFVGYDALEEATTPAEAFVGIELQERGVARNGYEVVDDDGHVIGEVTSGTMSPTLERGIALGYLPTDHTDPGTEVGVIVRGQEKRAKVTSPPFLDDK